MSFSKYEGIKLTYKDTGDHFFLVDALHQLERSGGALPQDWNLDPRYVDWHFSYPYPDKEEFEDDPDDPSKGCYWTANERDNPKAFK